MLYHLQNTCKTSPLKKATVQKTPTSSVKRDVDGRVMILNDMCKSN